MSDPNRPAGCNRGARILPVNIWRVNRDFPEFKLQNLYIQQVKIRAGERGRTVNQDPREAISHPIITCQPFLLNVRVDFNVVPVSLQ